jgi:hypothetical protein
MELYLILYTISIDLKFAVVNQKEFPVVSSWSNVLFTAAFLISTTIQESQNEAE